MATVTPVSNTNNPEIDGLLGGTCWTGTITYSFPDSPNDYAANYSGDREPTGTGFSPAPLTIQQAITYAFALISSYTNADIQFASTNGADIAIAQSPAADPTAYGYYPANAPSGGDIWFGTSYPYSQAELGNYYFATALHELGHAFGLKHSQETGSVADVAVPTAHDNSQFTVMSYRSYVGAPLTGYTAESYGYAQTYMANDILALQSMYGADYSTHSENTVYYWDATTGQQYVNGIAQLAPGDGAGGSANRIFETIWDGDGVDTYDLSNYGVGVTINLNPGASSITSATQIAYLGDGHYAQGNIFNAFLDHNDVRSCIDNAIGGAGNDFLTGNLIANSLMGGSGNDILTGGGANDTLDGGDGVDTAVFSGRPENFQWLRNPNGSFINTDLRTGSPDGTDIVQNVEAFEFDFGPDAAGGTTVATYDIGNAFSWSTETRTYDAQGRLSSILSKSDAGATFLTDYDLDHSNAWNMAVSTYDAQDRLEAASIYKDVTLVTTYDAAGSQSWRQAITGYDNQGRQDYVTVVNDNGSSLYSRYSYSGNIDYSIYSYDVQNHLTQSYIHHTNGTADIIV